MEEESIKSALEIAMERVSRLPELTPEEISKQKENKYRPMGEALGNRYMQGALNEHGLSAELRQYSGDAAPIVRKALTACLCQQIRLEDTATAMKAIDGLCLLAEDGGNLKERANAFWTELVGAYEQQKELFLKEQEGVIRKRLAGIGIAGSAVLPNPNADTTSAIELSELSLSFAPRLEALRALLENGIQTNA